jgi:small subunit ribosomal protein S17
MADMADENNGASGAESKPRGRRKVRIGTVVSDRMKDTVIVAIESRVRHPLYSKIVRRTTRFKAHDPGNQCGAGDRVEIMETRPISKEKRWRVVRIVEKAK